MNLHRPTYIPVARRACYVSFKGSDSELASILDRLGIWSPESAPRADKDYQLRYALAKNIVADSAINNTVRSQSLVNKHLVTWQVSLRFINDNVREYELLIHSIESIEPRTSDSSDDDNV